VSPADVTDVIHVLTAVQTELAHSSVAEESPPPSPPQPAANASVVAITAAIGRAVDSIRIGLDLTNAATLLHHPDRMTRPRADPGYRSVTP